MGLKNVLDGTADGALVLDASEILGANATSSSTGFDLGSTEPARFRVRIVVVSAETATATSAYIINVQGATSSDFLTNACSLGGSLILGNATAVTSNFFVQCSNARGAGEYVIDCTNQGLDLTLGQYGCRYIRLQTKSIGASAALVFAASIERAPMHS